MAVRKAPAAVRFRTSRGFPVFIAFIFAICLATGPTAAAAPIFSGGLGVMTGHDALEAVGASGGFWAGAEPMRVIPTQEFGVAWPAANLFAPGVFFNRMGFTDGVGSFELFVFGASFERMFPPLGSAGIRAGSGRATGNTAGDEWMADLEFFLRVALPWNGVYAAVSRQILLGAFGDIYQSTRVGVTVATPSAKR